jgi:hypothetical protein
MEDEERVELDITGLIGQAPARAPARKYDPWAHRSSGMRCRSCMFYVPKVATKETKETKELGRCRRHSPTMAGFPAVFPTDWCGDHKLDEAKL